MIEAEKVMARLGAASNMDAEKASLDRLFNTDALGPGASSPRAHRLSFRARELIRTVEEHLAGLYVKRQQLLNALSAYKEEG